MKICATTGPFKDLSLANILAIFDEVGLKYFEGSTDGRKHLYPYIFGNLDLTDLKEILDSYQCKLAVLSGGWADFAVKEDKIEQQYDSVIKQLQFCNTFSIATLRLFVSHIPSKYVDDLYFKRVITNIKNLLPEFREYDVQIAFENHGGITATANDVLTIIEGVSDDHVGVNFDPANFVPYGQDPVEALELTSPYIKHCHLKDVMFTNEGRMEGYEFVTLGQGMIDYQKIFKRLKDGAYKSFLSVECESKGDKVRSLIESKIYLKKLM